MNDIKVRLEDVCERGSSNLAQKDLENLTGDYPVYGAGGYVKDIDFYHQENEYIAVVKDGAGIGRTVFLPGKSSVIGTLQYLIPKDNIVPRYLYYAVASMKLAKYYTGATIPHIYFKDYKKEVLPLPDKNIQLEIVSILEKAEKIISYRKQQLDYFDNLIKSRFVEMFGDPKINPYGYDKKMLKETCKVVTGNTPSRAVAEYYGDYIEWVKTDNIVSGILNPTTAAEHLSEKGVNAGRTVDENSILMACIAGSIASIGRVCITNRKVAFNQQINAVVPESYNIYFVYVMLQISKDYLVEEINMALKGILSKSKLEEKIFFVPPIELQNQFATFVQQVDKLKVEVLKSLDETQWLFDSLMQKYFD